MSTAAAGRFKPGEGDWICGDQKCGNVNFLRRTQCNKCGREKNEGQDFKKGGAEIGKALAEKSKGLFSADDWQCKTCGNVNWARRMSCNMCNTPKYGKLEQRTGYGGGYMERDEVVEYKAREDSDTEFDEYGRRKKRFKGDENPAAQPQEDAGEEKEEEEEGDLSKYKIEDDDDDDDDDEDVDLSKYNLESDDESDEGSKPVGDEKSGSSPSTTSRSSSGSSSSRSRSRSRSRSHNKSSRKQPHSRSRSRSSSRHRRRHRSSRSYSSSPSRSRSRSRSKETRRGHDRRRRSRS